MKNLNYNFNFNVGDQVVLSGHKESYTGDRWRFLDEYILKCNGIKPNMLLVVKKVDTDDDSVLVAPNANVAGLWFDRSELRFASSREIERNNNTLKLNDLDFNENTYILEGTDGKSYFAYYDDGGSERNIWCIVLTNESDDIEEEELTGIDMLEHLDITDFKCIIACIPRKPQ